MPLERPHSFQIPTQIFLKRKILSENKLLPENNPNYSPFPPPKKKQDSPRTLKPFEQILAHRLASEFYVK